VCPRPGGNTIKVVPSQLQIAARISPKSVTLVSLKRAALGLPKFILMPDEDLEGV
jgi:hypothetical protein